MVYSKNLWAPSIKELVTNGRTQKKNQWFFSIRRKGAKDLELGLVRLANVKKKSQCLWQSNNECTKLEKEV